MAKKAKKEHYLNNPNLPTVDAKFEYTPEMVAEINKCKEHIIHFAENHFNIISVDDGKQKIQLHLFQKRALRMIRDNRFNLLLQSRQTGKTTIATIYCLWTAIFNDDQRILLVANKESTAKEIFKRIRTAYEGLPNWLKAPVQYYGLESLELANGSRISISTTTGTAARGQSANLLFVDEADFIDYNMLMEFWASVYPIISSSKKSKIILASTPRDTSGLFFKLYDGSVKGQNNWAHMKILWNEVPGRDEKWKRDTMASLSDPNLFKREFECEFDLVGDTAINTEVFEKLKENAKNPLYSLDEDRYTIWADPNPERIYVAGVDISEGIGKDWSIIQIIDVTNPTDIEQVAIYANNKMSPIEFTVKLRSILQNWGDPLALIERNACGATVVENLRKDFFYQNIVSWGSREANVGTNKKPQLGMTAHTNTKEYAIRNKQYWINTAQQVRLNDIQTINELKDFVRRKNGTYGAKSGSHDDRVMALVWALMILSEALADKFFDILEKDDYHQVKVINQMDFGVKYFYNPTSIYGNDSIGGDAMPSFLGSGHDDSEDMEISDLKNSGWKPL